MGLARMDDGSLCEYWEKMPSANTVEAKAWKLLATLGGKKIDRLRRMKTKDRGEVFVASYESGGCSSVSVDFFGEVRKPVRVKTPWYVYLLRCGEPGRTVLYCGATTNIRDRLHKHREGKAAKFTKGRLPIYLLELAGPFTRSEALKVEHLVKKQTAAKKMGVLRAQGGETPLYAWPTHVIVELQLARRTLR